MSKYNIIRDNRYKIQNPQLYLSFKSDSEDNNPFLVITLITLDLNQYYNKSKTFLLFFDQDYKNHLKFENKKKKQKPKFVLLL